MKASQLPVTEAEVQRTVCDWLRAMYPGVIFNSDGAGNYVSPAQAQANMYLRSSPGYPDLFIAAPRGRWAGLFLELKVAGFKFCFDEGCTLPSHAHMHQQREVLQALQDAGYRVDVACGADEAMEKIGLYMALGN